MVSLFINVVSLFNMVANIKIVPRAESIKEKEIAEEEGESDCRRKWRQHSREESDE